MKLLIKSSKMIFDDRGNPLACFQSGGFILVIETEGDLSASTETVIQNEIEGEDFLILRWSKVTDQVM